MPPVELPELWTAAAVAAGAVGLSQVRIWLSMDAGYHFSYHLGVCFVSPPKGFVLSVSLHALYVARSGGARVAAWASRSAAWQKLFVGAGGGDCWRSAFLYLT